MLNGWHRLNWGIIFFFTNFPCLLQISRPNLPPGVSNWRYRQWFVAKVCWQFQEELTQAVLLQPRESQISNLVSTARFLPEISMSTTHVNVNFLQMEETNILAGKCRGVMLIPRSLICLRPPYYVSATRSWSPTKNGQPKVKVIPPRPLLLTLLNKAHILKATHHVLFHCVTERWSDSLSLCTKQNI